MCRQHLLRVLSLRKPEEEVIRGYVERKLDLTVCKKKHTNI